MEVQVDGLAEVVGVLFVGEDSLVEAFVGIHSESGSGG